MFKHMSQCGTFYRPTIAGWVLGMHIPDQSSAQANDHFTTFLAGIQAANLPAPSAYSGSLVVFSFE